MQKRALIIQDMCCVGQCSLAVSLPILSALGIEACPLPTAVLSSHSVGFKRYSRTNLLDSAKTALGRLKQEGIFFDAVLAGYMSDVGQRDVVLDAVGLLKEGGEFYLDPAMADFGKLYPDLNPSTVGAMGDLAKRAFAITPNYAEACLLAGVKEDKCATIAALYSMAEKLTAEGAQNVVITGADVLGEGYGAFAFDGRSGKFYPQPKVDRACHGAGDVFFAAFAGLSLCGIDFMPSAKAAADFTLESILNTLDDKSHWYGINFEGKLGELIKTRDSLK